MQKVTDWFLSIEWETEGLPSSVGPFASDVEAATWAGMNIPNGSWEIAPLARPYAHATQRIFAATRR